jgi:hypothetical protein
MLRRFGLAAAILLLAGCTGEPRPARGADDTAQELAARLRAYVYATYDVQQKPDETTLESLKRARAGLADEMARAGLGSPDKEQGLAPLVRPLAQYFATHSDLVFLPLPPEASGVALVRASERREVVARDIAGRPATYRVVLFDEMPIEDFDRYRAHGGPPRGSVANVSGTTIFLDRGLARRIAREVVLPREADVRALAPRAAEGKATRAELKDLLRFRALESAIAQGEDALVRAILAEEETRIAALFAVTGALSAEQARDPGLRAHANRDAVLAAAVAGDPRYQLAAAIATTLGAPDSPAAVGAEAALQAVAGTADRSRESAALTALGPDELRARAKVALAPR